VVVVCSYNNASRYKKNLDSIFSQKYSNYRVIYTDDCSPDGTGKLVSEYIKKHSVEDKITLIQNENRMYQLYNMWSAIHSCQDHEIIMIVDGDDYLAHDMVMQRINYEYQTKDILLTYGQFKHLRSGKIGFCKNFPTRIIESKSYRKGPWISSHLRTFYAGLFKQIQQEDLMREDKFFQASADQATMIPMLEMADGRVSFIKDILYIYTGSRCAARAQRAASSVLKRRRVYPACTEFSKRTPEKIIYQTLEVFW
jgi:glycosyltransferase involved in cell wall biosynthesis